MSHIITLIASVASHPVPDYILENLSELAGTLIASLLIAIVTTYVFSRRQEVQKVRARILHYRLEQYAQIIQCLGRYSDQHSWEGMIREQVLDVLEQAGLPLGNEDLIAPSVLTNESESICLLKELETLSIKGLYILDNDVLEKLLEVKIYLRLFRKSEEVKMVFKASWTCFPRNTRHGGSQVRLSTAQTRPWPLSCPRSSHV